MSEFNVRVVRVAEIKEHGNADSLELVEVEGYPVVVAKNSFNVGDLAVYVPIDSIVPCNRPEFSFLAQVDLSTADKEAGKTRDTYRIKAKKLRGVFSMGLLIPWDDGYALDMERNEGTLQELLGITKWEPPLQISFSGNAASGPEVPYPTTYTDIEGFRKYQDVFTEDDNVWISEKIHGTNARFMYKDGQLHVGSHHRWWKNESDNLYWRAAKQYNLEELLSKYPGLILYGEIYGVQDLKYGLKNGEIAIRFFDISEDGRYMSWYSFFNTILVIFNVGEMEGYEYIVPVLYQGKWHPELVELANGTSVMPNAQNQVREGIVVKPLVEQFDSKLMGRKILKLIGEGYLLRKNA